MSCELWLVYRLFPLSHTELITSTTSTACDTPTIDPCPGGGNPLTSTLVAALQLEQRWIDALCLALIMLPKCRTPAPSTNFCDEDPDEIERFTLVAIAAGTVPNRPLPSQCRPRRPRSRNSLSANRRRRGLCGAVAREVGIARSELIGEKIRAP